MSTSIAKIPLRQVETVQQLLVNDMAKQQIATVAAEHMRPERMLRLMANAIRTTPKLGECQPLSLLGAMMTCASLGLEPNTLLGHAYLIPFENRRKKIVECQLIIGYKGFIDLARRSGLIVSIHADVVYAKDEFSFEYGSNQHLRHIPKGERKGPVWAYCHARLVDGEAFIVLPWSEVLKIRDASQGYRYAVEHDRKDNPWMTHEHQMARKTAVRALFSELPISIEKVSDAIQTDDTRVDFTAMALGDQVTIEAEPQEEPEAHQEETPAGDGVTKTRSQTAKAVEGGPDTRKQEKATQRAAPDAREASQTEPPAALVELLKGRLSFDLASANNTGEIEAVLELFADQIELMREWEELAAQLDELETTAREAVSK